MSNQYYIQRIASGLLGNSPVWWAKGGNGYTSYLQNAERFSEEDAAKLVMGSDKYAMWSCEEINKRLHLVYDIQDKRNLGTDDPCSFNGAYATNPDYVDKLEKERDTAWEELRKIREAIKANPEESTFDEVMKVVSGRDERLVALKRLEDACDKRASCLSREAYLVAERCKGMREALYEMDNARSEARETIAKAKAN